MGLVGDERMKGQFAYKFQMEFDDAGIRVFKESPSHGSLNFQKHAERIGDGVVPIGIVA